MIDEKVNRAWHIDKERFEKCVVTRKLCFNTYTDCLKFARKVMHATREKKKRLGRNFCRNVSPSVREEMQACKKCKSIYVCKYCGQYHFSSTGKVIEKKAPKHLQSFYKEQNAM